MRAPSLLVVAAALTACAVGDRVTSDDLLPAERSDVAVVDASTNASPAPAPPAPPPPPPPAPASVCAGRFDDLGACRTCAESKCCTEAALCDADASCRKHMAACQQNGGGTYADCTAQVDAEPDATQATLRAYYACAFTACGPDCGFTPK
jgi:hypothetical protein